MAITLAEALKLEHVKPLKLIAGQSGLKNQINKIGILDHELIEGVSGMFRYGDFVLTTFTPIRSNMLAIEKCIRDLIACKVSALAIKSIYIKDLPQEIIDLADQAGFPILLFEADVYFEDIIEDLMKGMQSRDHIEILEAKIDTLFKTQLKPDLVAELCRDLNPHFKSCHQVLYLKEKRYIGSEINIAMAERYRRSRKQLPSHSVFKYKKGLFIILTYDSDVAHKSLDRDQIFKVLNLDKEAYYMGSARGLIETFDNSLREAYYACKVCEIENTSELRYDEIGVYQLLMPHNDVWMKKYVSTILTPIKSYDDGKLIETARIYIKNKGDIVKTAEDLYQHKNTIRYRITKMKDLLKVHADGDFYEQLSIAIKCERMMI